MLCLSGAASSSYVCHRREGICVIEARFGTIEAFVNCSNHDEIVSNQFTAIDEIAWNGCSATVDLERFGLGKIPKKQQVKSLQIEKFALGALTTGTFDGFVGLENLSIEHNRIENLSSSCFRGLKSLKRLRLMENHLKWMDSGLLVDVAALRTLEISDGERLLIGNHQFAERQALESVVLKMYYIEMDLLEHLLAHVRNLSISTMLDGTNECHQARLNGFEKNWIIEALNVENFSCGFDMENVSTIKTLKLNRAVRMAYADFKLKNLPSLEALHLHENVFDDASIFRLEGMFDSLQLIDIANNSMSRIDMKLFETCCTNLRRLNLSGDSLTKLDNFEEEKFRHVALAVDGNGFDCSWLNSVAVFDNFVFEKNFDSFNFRGLSCHYSNTSTEQRCEGNETLDFIDAERQHRELLKLVDDNFILAPEALIIVVCVSVVLGAALTFASIYVHRRRQILKHTPFYHLLRRSIVGPMTNVKRDIKEIITRNLPPTNYEHPISETVTEMSDVSVDDANIYEEIPPKLNAEVE